MIYTQKIQHAVGFAIKTHEIYQKQKRKGKDVPYIIHPLTVGIILAAAGADEELITAGILHDTIEDSIEEKKVTKEMITERFGEKVAQLVLSITEQDKSLPWEVRKYEAIEHIKTFSDASVFLKSADILSNTSDLIYEYKKHGDEAFLCFTKASKEKIVKRIIDAIEALLLRWPQNPLKEDLQIILGEIKNIK